MTRINIAFGERGYFFLNQASLVPFFPRVWLILVTYRQMMNKLFIKKFFDSILAYENRPKKVLEAY